VRKLTRGLSVVLMLVLPSALVACGDDNPDQPDAGYEDWELEDLSGTQGFSLRTPEFDVASGAELQDCYFVAVPDVNGDGSDVWIDRAMTAINPGSHHTNVFRVGEIRMLDPAAGTAIDLGNGLQGTFISEGECWKSPNWAGWPIVANSQNSSIDNPYTDWQLPDNVAMRFTPGEMLMLQVHYVNATTQTTPFRGKVGVNFYRTEDVAPMELGTLFATQQSIRICESDPEPSYHGTCALPEGDYTVVAANGHFHSRGRQFDIFAWDGVTTEEPTEAPFYVSEDWAEPPMSLDLDVTLPQNGGIWWTCDFQWAEPEAVDCAALNEVDPQAAGDCCYTFGGKVELNEHCNVFMYYYPKAEGSITCN
jgi:hypothetical protein